jgi:hypothetical protein
MRKLTCAALVLCFFCIQSAVLAGNGNIEAKRYPTKISGNLADHTYVCAGGCYTTTIPAGGTSGGDYCSGTRGYGDQGKTYCETQKSYCYLLWAVQGLCHQSANRLLYPVRTTVSGCAKGYWVFWPKFGTYGDPSGGAASWLLCKSKCKL